MFYGEAAVVTSAVDVYNQQVNAGCSYGDFSKSPIESKEIVRGSTKLFTKYVTNVFQREPGSDRLVIEIILEFFVCSNVKCGLFWFCWTNISLYHSYSYFY